MPRHILIFTVFCLIGVFSGCGPRDGIIRYPIRGTVTYDDKPIPYGVISFTPDAGQGNLGAPAFAVIKNGHYDTQKTDSPVGGPHEITIMGYDGIAFTDGMGIERKTGKPLFSQYNVKMDLPKKKGEKIDFTVPK